MMTPLQSQPRQHIKQRAGLIGLRVEVAGVTQIGGAEKREHRGVAAACGKRGRRRVPVVRQPPSGIPRLPEADHRLARHQRFKTEVRRHGINPRYAPQQRLRAGVFGYQPQARIRADIAQIATLTAVHDIRMRFYPDFGIRVFSKGALQHQPKRCRAGIAEGDRHIARRLIHHQHRAGIGRAVKRRRVVILRQIAFHDKAHRLLRRFAQRRVARSILNQVLQRAWLAGVVVNAVVIDNQRERRMAVRRRAARADKSVFKANHRKPGFAGAGNGRRRAGAMPPHGDSGNIVRDSPTRREFSTRHRQQVM